MSKAFYINHRCTSCDACLPLCPTESIYIGTDHYIIDSDTCHGCSVCVRVCPVNAILPVHSKPALKDVFTVMRKK